MKFLRKLLLFSTAALALSGCFFPVRMTRVIGSGEVATETREVSGFSAVDLSGIGKLIIDQGNSESLTITAEENLIPYLETRVTGKELHLGVRDYVNIDPREEIVFRLTVVELERLESSGLGKIEIAALESEDLDIQISGAGDLTIGELMADSFRLEISGAGNAVVAGEVTDQRIELSGAGNYQAGDLLSEEARVQISGAGRAVVWAEGELDVEISGSGSLQYYGSPILNTEMSGAGTLEGLPAK